MDNIQGLANMISQHFSNPKNHLDQDTKHVSKKEFEKFINTELFDFRVYQALKVAYTQYDLLKLAKKEGFFSNDDELSKDDLSALAQNKQSKEINFEPIETEFKRETNKNPDWKTMVELASETTKPRPLNKNLIAAPIYSFNSKSYMRTIQAKAQEIINQGKKPHLLVPPYLGMFEGVNFGNYLHTAITDAKIKGGQPIEIHNVGLAQEVHLYYKTAYEKDLMGQKVLLEQAKIGNSISQANPSTLGLGLEWNRNPALKVYACTLMPLNYDFWVMQRSALNLQDNMSKQLFEGNQQGYLKAARSVSFLMQATQKEHAKHINDASQKILKSDEIGIVLMPYFLLGGIPNSHAFTLASILNFLMQADVMTPEWKNLNDIERFQLITELSSKVTEQKMEQYFASRIKDKITKNNSSQHLLFWLKELDPTYSAKIWNYVNPILKQARGGNI